jgi:hypothetical protein
VCCRHDTSAAGDHWATRWEHASAQEKKRALSAGFNHHGLCWPPRPSAVRCRAESSARASGRLQVIIIAAAAAICCVDGWMWMVCRVQTHQYSIAAVCARMPACTPVRQSRVAPFGASYNRGYLGLKVARRGLSGFLLGSAWLGGLASRARAGDRPSSKRTA